MKQLALILIFGGVFVLGLVAERWIVSPDYVPVPGKPQSVAAAASNPLAGANPVTTAVAPFESVADVVGEASDGTVRASFEVFAENRSTAGAEIVTHVRPSMKVTRDQVRFAITERFPHLSAEAVSGWTDTYEGTPLDELELLLEQRQSLPSILPGRSVLSQASSEFSKLQPTPIVSPGPFARASTVIHQNLRRAATPGFRRRRIVTGPEPFSASTESADGLRQRQVFDFRPGAIHPSGQPLHLAIVDHPELMFQLQPGNLLTRSGAFIRLADGRLGIETAKGAVALSGQLVIPEEVGAMFVSTTGVVRFNDFKGKVHSVGNLRLAVVTGLGDLDSLNGVFFTTSAAPAAIPTTEDTPVMTNSLESSNVDIDLEWKLADHYARLNSMQGVDESDVDGLDYPRN